MKQFLLSLLLLVLLTFPVLAQCPGGVCQPATVTVCTNGQCRILQAPTFYYPASVLVQPAPVTVYYSRPVTVAPAPVFRFRAPLAGFRSGGCANGRCR